MGWSEKFKAWQESLDEQERNLVCFVKEQRRREVHRKGAYVVPTQWHIAKTFYPHVQPLSLRVMLQGFARKGTEGRHNGLAMLDSGVDTQDRIPLCEGASPDRPCPCRVCPLPYCSREVPVLGRERGVGFRQCTALSRTGYLTTRRRVFPYLGITAKLILPQE